MNRGGLVIGAAERRWVHVGPYFAMFPIEYVEDVIRRYTCPGDAVLDPFAGRFTTTAVANYAGRPGCGIEINPLGWLYGRVKLHPAQLCEDVLRRLEDMRDAAIQYSSEAESMNEFFSMCYCTGVRRFLLACRSLLRWKTSLVDATVMASIMIVLHHGVGRGLSNQMHQAKAMAPRYSVKWWRRQGMGEPPDVEPVEFLSRRIRWRYAQGTFGCERGMSMFGDSCEVLRSGEASAWAERHGGVKLLFTSPPYWSLVNYFKDQWLRLWMLGEEASQAEREHAFEKRFGAKEEYRELIRTVFSLCAGMMRKDGVVVVRMDERAFTRETILEALGACFPTYLPATEAVVTRGRRQTALFNRIAEPPGERDVVLKAA